MMYVLRHIETGKYVARSGSKSSYVRSLEAARTFASFEAAKAEACVESETPVALSNLISEPEEAHEL